MSDNAILDFHDLVDLASERLGGGALACSDEFFAGMDNLVKAKKPVWDEDAYTDRGKWMDGWESKRSHQENHGDAHSDWVLVRLGAAGVVRGVVVDTAFFRGNFPAQCELEGISIDGYPPPDDIVKADGWITLVPRTALQGNAENAFSVSCPHRLTHVRLRVFPDGGVARLRVFGEAIPDWRKNGGLDGELDLASVSLGGLVVACSDMFFGSRHNLIFPGSSSGMHDGWETRRSRRQGSDWAVVRLGARGSVTRIIVDTAHFKGNCPESFSLDGAAGWDGERTTWTPLFPRTPLQPHTAHTFSAGFTSTESFTHVRLSIFPDGGVSRLRIFGRLPDDEKGEQRVRRLNTMPEHEAQRALLSCCGAERWVTNMLSLRPFSDEQAVLSAADVFFDGLSNDDWLEAFRAHPKLGGAKAVRSTTLTSAQWSVDEQRGIAQAAEAERARLVQLNDEYEKKHGFIFILFASGKSSDDVRAALEKRLGNTTDAELRAAANEQRQITAARLKRLG